MCVLYNSNTAATTLQIVILWPEYINFKRCEPMLVGSEFNGIKLQVDFANRGKLKYGNNKIKLLKMKRKTNSELKLIIGVVGFFLVYFSHFYWFSPCLSLPVFISHSSMSILHLMWKISLTRHSICILIQKLSDKNQSKRNIEIIQSISTQFNWVVSFFLSYCVYFVLAMCSTRMRKISYTH